jgi:hypothetical protein
MTRPIACWRLLLLAAALPASGCPAASPVATPAPQADVAEPSSPDVDGEGVREPECDEPADCAERAACVTTSLGGPVGCTGVECCGANECGNGCRSDGDCPACRPVCRRGEGQETGYCWNPTGP